MNIIWRTISSGSVETAIVPIAATNRPDINEMDSPVGSTFCIVSITKISIWIYLSYVGWVCYFISVCVFYAYYLSLGCHMYMILVELGYCQVCLLCLLVSFWCTNILCRCSMYKSFLIHPYRNTTFNHVQYSTNCY